MAAIVLVFGVTACVSHPPVSHADERGHYVFGHEVNTFEPCGSEDVLWIEGTDSVVNALARKYAELTTEPHERVYVELQGDRSAPAPDGFAADYDGLFAVDKVLAIRQQQPGDCD